MKITWIGQSGYIISTESTQIIIDPYLSDIVNKVANRPRMVDAPIAPEAITADAVICTHDHLDHLDPDAVTRMNDDLLFITTNEGKAHLAELGKNNVNAVSAGDSVNVGDISITAVYADHTVEAFGLIIEADGIKMYFSGDTLFNQKLFDIADCKPDITFICINGKLGNMNVDEAVAVAKKIGAEINVPNHYGMFASNTEDPTKFTDRINGGFIMELGKEYNISKTPKISFKPE